MACTAGNHPRGGAQRLRAMGLHAGRAHEDIPWIRWIFFFTPIFYYRARGKSGSGVTIGLFVNFSEMADISRCIFVNEMTNLK